MSNWLQIPKEAPWLYTTLKVFVRELKSLWKEGADLSSVTVYSNWIMEEVDIRGWAHRLGTENGDNMVKTGRGLYILLLLTPPLEVPKDTRDAYWSWVEDEVLTPIKEQYPDLYAWICEWQRRQISELADIELTGARNGTTNTTYIRSALAQAALEQVPPLIRESLLEMKRFREEFGFKSDAVLTFGKFGVSVQRSELFDAIRKILSGESEMEVTDTEGREWKLKNEGKEGELPILTVSRSNQRLVLPDLTALSPNTTVRLRSFGETVSDVNLPTGVRNMWHDVLLERALNDDEVDVYNTDFRDTPVQVTRSIRSEIEEGRSNTSSLVPNSRRYFERLVGSYDGSASILDYAAESGRQFIRSLSEWRPYDGFLFSLLLSSHSSLTAEIVVEKLHSEEIVRAFDFLERQGDRISQLGAIEVGLRILSEMPAIEPVIIRLVERIRDDDVDGLASGFKLLTALFVLVDGELSRTRLLSAEPPFYRRLASLSQAALIHRQLIDSDIEIDRFCEWAFSNRGGQYYMQTLSDMRLEPRWNPDLVVASQLKAEFFGRILSAATNYERSLAGSKLYDLVLGPGSDSIKSLSDRTRPYLPGPLEGGENSLNNVPAEISKIIEAQLSAEEVGPSSFIALLNTALIFQHHVDHAELAEKALKLSGHRIANVGDRSQLLGILNGLASVAATTRSSSLADELRILVRIYRQDAQYALSIEEAIRICLVAAASRRELNDWREFVGDCLTELAFGKLEGNDGVVLHIHLQHICHAVPELWLSCGRADAALKALNSSRHSI